MKRYLLIALALCLGLASTASARTWSAEELSQYSHDQIDAMGNDNLPLQIAYWEWAKSEADAVVAQWEPQVLPLRQQASDLDAQIADLNRQISDLRRAIDDLRNSGVNHLIVEGECLWTIASYHYYYNDGARWPMIYDRNRDKISDPDLIYAGDTIIVPVPLVNQYTVVEGDFLGKIAGYAVVYGDRGLWPQLYEANRGQISDPNLIFPGQVLSVTRTGSRAGGTR
jgi:nucleoid-associated protein YgaU